MFGGAAVVFTLSIASFISETILFTPATIIT